MTDETADLQALVKRLRTALAIRHAAMRMAGAVGDFGPEHWIEMQRLTHEAYMQDFEFVDDISREEQPNG